MDTHVRIIIELPRPTVDVVKAIGYLVEPALRDRHTVTVETFTKEEPF